MGDVRGGLIIDKDSANMMGGNDVATGEGKGKTNLNPTMAYSEASFGGGGGNGGGSGELGLPIVQILLLCIPEVDEAFHLLPVV